MTAVPVTPDIDALLAQARFPLAMVFFVGQVQAEQFMQQSFIDAFAGRDDRLDRGLGAALDLQPLRSGARR